MIGGPGGGESRINCLSILLSRPQVSRANGKGKGKGYWRCSTATGDAPVWVPVDYVQQRGGDLVRSGARVMVLESMWAE